MLNIRIGSDGHVNPFWPRQTGWVLTIVETLGGYVWVVRDLARRSAGESSLRFLLGLLLRPVATSARCWGV